MDDRVLQKSVMDELGFEPSVDAANIGVAVDNGVVTLSGHVASYAEKIAAEKAVRRVKGVSAIAQELTVRYPGSLVVTDDELAKRCLQVIAWDAFLLKDTVRVKVEKGWVTLEGTLQSHYQRVAAEKAVRKLTGVAGVNNLIQIKAKGDAAEIKKRIEEAFRRNAALDAKAIRVTVDNDKVTLEGSVREWHERIVAESAAWSAPGVNAVVDHLRFA